MIRSRSLIIFLLCFFIYMTDRSVASAVKSDSGMQMMQQDSILQNQILFNGRIWKNLYYMIEGDQFLFSEKFLPGSLTIGNNSFSNITLKYDIFNDEILTPLDSGGIVRLNNEMVDSFSLLFQNKKYHFIRIPKDSLNELEGYANILFRGKTSLYVKYTKKIDRPKIEERQDNFYQFSHIYVLTDRIYYMVDSRRELLKVIEPQKTQIKDFMKKNKIRISRKLPDSYIPVIRYYNTISQ